MSVLKNKRKTSRLEFLHNAYVMQRTFVMLMLRDFGTKAKIRSTNYFAKMYKMDEADKEKFLEIADKYDISSIVDEYPSWLIQDMRNRLQQELRFLIRNIIQANSIYPVYMFEFEDRRRYQTAAIGNCEQILQEMQYIIYVLDVNVNKFLPFVDMIEKEIALLKAWRRSDKRLLPHIREHEAKEHISRDDVIEEMRKIVETDEANNRHPPNKKKKPRKRTPVTERDNEEKGNTSTEEKVKSESDKPNPCVDGMPKSIPYPKPIKRTKISFENRTLS